MNITYNYLVPLEAERIALDNQESYVTVGTTGRSATIKVISGSAYVCGEKCPIDENGYILEQGEALSFCGGLKILAKSPSFEARVLYFDSI